MFARMLLPRGVAYEGRYRGDCLAALSIFRKPGAKDARGEAPWGGLGRAAHADGARAECAAFWIRAHVDLEGIHEPTLRAEHAMNHEADRLAVAAAKGASPRPAVVGCDTEALNGQIAWPKTAVAVPDARDPVRAKRVRASAHGSLGKKPQGPQHEWAVDRYGDAWCTKCLRHKRELGARGRDDCAEALAVVRAVSKASLGHSIVAMTIAGTDALLSHCTRCGGFAVSSMRLLAQQCRPRPPAAQPARSAILNGKHPKSGAKLGPHRSVRSWHEAAQAPDD
jgi:hypothetical protein